MVQAISLAGSYNARGIGMRGAPWLVRSAALDGLSPGGERTLRSHGVDLVLDLREPAEHGERTHGIPVRSLSLYGEAPPASGSLEEVYEGLVRDRGDRLAAAVIAIAEHPGTVVVHCTAGKDRTGLVVALTRLAAGDPLADVLADYALSGGSVRPEREALVAIQLDRIGLDAPGRAAERTAAERLHLDSPSDALVSALDAVEALGGVEAYLLAHGATRDHLAALADLAAGERQDAPSGAHAHASAMGSAA
ncbi:tyrosine-protein phosphatase [Leucobacter celer]|uniref:tyrosine-protein phosphatase n=1 Tax=Leucobacter celer TaxID=668625 RepID=UPI00094980A2|nr:tyrosine-protein phosphatase [Leucobacter celer]